MASGSLVVGVDGSEGSATALQWSIAAARRLGLSVSAVFAYSPWAATFFSVPPFDADDLRRTLRAEFESAWIAPLADSGLEYRTRLFQAEAPDALLQAAEKDHAALIALGAHGHSRWSPHLLGGVTAKVLHHSRWPVAVVPHPLPRPAFSGGFIVGVDGSAWSRSALRWAAAQARPIGGWVRAVCVTPVHSWHEEPRFVSPADGRLLDVEQGLQALADEVGAAEQVDVETTLAIGDPASVLPGLGDDGDLLVLGSRGHTSLGEVVFGSVVRTCATRATRPVLIVPQLES